MRLLIALLLAPAAFAGSAIVQYNYCTGASPLACSFASTPTVGNLVVVGSAFNGSSGTSSAADNQGGGNTYTNRLHATTGGGAVDITSTTVAVASGTFTVTFTQTGINSIAIAEYSGVTDATIDGTSNGVLNSPPLHAGSTTSLTTTFNFDTVVCLIYNASGGTLPSSPSAGFNLRNSSPVITLSHTGLMDSFTSTTLSGADPTYSGASGNATRNGCVSFKNTSQSAGSIRHKVIE